MPSLRLSVVFPPAFAVLSIFALGCILASRPALAAPPKVATSIKPVQALVKMVMGSLATPDLIVPATASPHVFALKPSQAKMLSNADVVFWIGPSLETTLEGPLASLVNSDARVVALIDTPGLDFIHREDTHDDEGATTDRHGHDHGTIDPHIWLSPKNGRILIDAIARELSALDPDNAPDYAKNAKKARQRIALLIKKVAAFTAEMQVAAYLVQHDGFAYIARDFSLNEVGYIQTQPGREPGAKHVAELLARIKSEKIKCLFHETQFSPKLARQLNKETKISLREIDPLGIEVMMTETAYVRIIQKIIMQMETCLYPRGSSKVKPAPVPVPKIQ